MPIVLATDETLWEMIAKTMNKSDGVEKAVIFILIGFSLISWSVIFWKLFSFFEARRNIKKFLTVFDTADSFGEAMAHGSGAGPSPVLTVFKAAMITLENRNAPSADAPSEARGIKINPGATREEVIELSMKHTAGEYFAKLQYGLGFLATAGSATPFIGLFGTVWGILQTLHKIAAKASGDGAGALSNAEVLDGISSTLIATAAGLAVAIPAVIAYNSFLANIDGMQEKTDRFIERVMMLIRSSGAMITNTHGLPIPAKKVSAPSVAPAEHAAPVAQANPAKPHSPPPNPAPVPTQAPHAG